MKKVFAGTAVIMAALVFSYCSSSKHTTGAAPANQPVAKVNYQAHLASLVETNCAPCHFPDKGGKKKPLDTYNSVKSNIDDILERIQKNPTDHGFMPARHAKLSDSTINLFKEWKSAGMASK